MVPAAMGDARGIDFTYSHVPGSDTPVVLLPGLVGADWIWAGTVQGLRAAGHSTLVWNTPIALLDADLASSLENLRGAVVGLLDHLSVDRALLCGSSLGALLALDFGSKHGDRTAGLVVSGSPGMHETVLDTEYLLEHTDRETLLKYGTRLFYTQPDEIDPELVEYTLEMVLDRSNALKILRAFQAARTHDTTGILPSIEAPVRMIWGENDMITPIDGWRPHIESIPAAELHVIPGCGHAPMIEKPEEWVGQVVEFVDRTLGTREGATQSPAVESPASLAQ